MQTLDRRSFLRHSALAGGALFGLDGLIARGALAQAGGNGVAGKGEGGYGPLSVKAAKNTGERILALPEGFEYNVFGVRGSLMSDGRPTPGGHDGMAAFPGENGLVRLVRNHELGGGAPASAANGDRPYDPKALGGTTTLIVDPATRDLAEAGKVAGGLSSYVSLSGTVRNCAGGPTPWGSWITCEETTLGPAASNSYREKHGYNFDVSAYAPGEVAPVPLKAMGRFSHEAVAVDPATGIVYQTEDANPSGFYRFLPYVPGQLAQGGRLQMLALKHRPNYDTRTGQRPGRHLLCTWVDIAEPDPDLAAGALSVYRQGEARGGAKFSRLEGCWQGYNSIFFDATSGGDIGEGQIWQYRPLPSGDGHLTLIYESRDPNKLDNPDNLCVSPRGGLVLCEDGDGVDYLRGLTPRGQIFDFAYNAISTTEFAGATYSPDGQILFVNAQGLGQTYAIWGPWAEGAL